MTNRTNPHENAQQQSRDALRRGYLSFGRVTSAPDTTSDGQHHVTVQETSAPSDEPLPVLPGVHGDYYIPPVGAPVGVIPRGPNRYNVIAAGIPQVQTPTIQAGERVISHPLSNANVKFNADGSVDIWGDSTIRINGGTQGVITDVSGSGVSTVEREPSILI